MKLSKEEKIIRLARSFGWTDIRYTRQFLFGPAVLTGCIPGDSQRLPLPDFFRDLNAVHDLELQMSDLEQKRFRGWLVALFKTDKASAMVHARAVQRAEAIGITRKLWEVGE